jgi:hypothetical protein
VVLQQHRPRAGRAPFEVTRNVHRADLTGLLYELPVEQ